jgi:DNA-binding MarR family transcriptional regulator
MKTETPSPFAITAKFAELAELWLKIDKKPRQFGTDQDLYRAEVQLIEVLGRSDRLSVTDIAEILGITKGAVSQTLKKLEKKGLVTKNSDPLNQSRLLVDLTAKGKVAYYAHEHWHETMDGGFRDYFMSLPEAKLRFLDEFLLRLEVFLKKRM